MPPSGFDVVTLKAGIIDAIDHIADEHNFVSRADVIERMILESRGHISNDKIYSNALKDSRYELDKDGNITPK